MKVLIYPHRAKVANPYLHDLTATSEEITFEDWTPLRALRGGFEILHVHWPESVWNEQSFVRSALRGTLFLALVSRLSLGGASIVTTVHNLRPHDNPHPRLDRSLTRLFDRLVDRVHILAESSRPACVERFGPERTIDVVPMGSFVENYEDAASSEASPRGDLMLHFGGLSAYKNTAHLVSTFCDAQLSNWTLLIAGKPASDDIEAGIRLAAGGDPRITLRLGHVDETDIPAIHASARLAVLPFTAIENSSTVMLALSLGVPVLAPHLGALPELRREVGPDWLQLYDGELTREHLEVAAEWAKAADSRRYKPNLASYDWEAVRISLLRSYQSVRAAQSRS